MFGAHVGTVLIMILCHGCATLGCLMSTMVTKHPKANQAGNEISKPETYPTGKLIVGPSSGRLEAYQGSPSNVPGTMFFH